MSSTNKTANLNMHSWAPTDPVVRQDFNENFSKIDAAIGQMRATYGGCEIYAGTYTGTGMQVYSLTFPKLPVYFIVNRDGQTAIYSVFVRNGSRLFASSSAYATLSVSGKTVTFTNESGSGPMNNSGFVHHYIAFAPAQQ